MAARAGHIYVADTGNHRIQVYDSSGVWVRTIGATGKRGYDNLHFNGPVGVHIGNDGKIYIADSDNNRVVKISDVSSDIGALNQKPVPEPVTPTSFLKDLMENQALLIGLIALIIVIIIIWMYRATLAI